MTHILVIGGASSDILHFGAQTVTSAGGAGLYTALAACRCGMQVSLLAPHPDPMPETLFPFAERLTAWHGPIVPPEELPHFEIAHTDGKSTYIKTSFGAEAQLTHAMLPPDVSSYDCIHIVPLGDTRQQFAFVQACRQRGAKRISAGTCLPSVTNDADIVHAIMQQADWFFMNQTEATSLFGSVDDAKTKPGKVLFVTQGKRGVLVIQGNHVTHVPVLPCDELDPTGAGDTFCGATLTHLIRGEHPVIAARSGIPVAAEITEHIGPTALYFSQPAPGLHVDDRVMVDQTQLDRVSQLIATLTDVTPFDFTGPDFPPVGHSAMLDFFFASILQQFGFWSAERDRYQRPLIAPINGVEQKGSSYLFQTYLRPLDTDPAFYTPIRQANLTRSQMLALFRADDGSHPMPALDLHLSQARQYGSDMLDLKLAPRDVLERAQASDKPLGTFIAMLDYIGGYKEDPLRKKTGLLAIILNQRPEKLLTYGAHERASPVIDYHLMRSCLRIGLIDVVDQTLREKLVRRQVMSPVDEWAVRYAVYTTIEQVVTVSGKSMGAVDWFFFNARKRCPEMSEPLCQSCQVDPVCCHRKELFQPVLRTTYY